MHTPSDIPQIHNFPKGFPWYKKLGSFITYWFSQIPLGQRRNNLSRDDIRNIWQRIQTGDILVVGDFREMSGIFIDGVVTHALGYVGRGRCIHAFGAHGVGYVGLGKVLRKYDTLIILRPYYQDEIQKVGFCQNLIEKIGKPYDFFFGLEQEGGESYYCSELINECLIETGYPSHLHSLRRVHSIVDKILDDTFRAHRALLPDDMIYGNFDRIYISHNLGERDGKYEIIGGKFDMIL